MIDIIMGQGMGMFMVALALQSVAGPPVPPRPIDLRAAIPQPCPPTQGEDIIVCGRREQGPRLVPLPDRVSRSPDDAMTFRLPGGGSGKLHAIQSELPGATGQGAAVTLTLPFGKGRKRD